MKNYRKVLSILTVLTLIFVSFSNNSQAFGNNLDAEASNVGATSATITWSTVYYYSGHFDFEPATYYSIEIKTIGTGSQFEEVANHLTGNAYLLTGLQPDTNYLVKVTAHKPHGSGYIGFTSNTAKLDTLELLTIATEVDGQGTATVNGSTSVQVSPGDTLTFVATPATGYKFDGWSPTTPVTATESATYTAHFSKLTYNISVSATFGDAQVNGTTSIVAEYGDTLVFTSTPNPGYHLVGWDQELPATALANGHYTVTYAINQYTIGVTATTGGTASVNGASSVTVDHGTALEFVAEADEGYYFNGWNTTTPETALEDGSYEAQFLPIPQYNVTAEYDSNHVSVSGTGTYYQGEGFTFTATPDDHTVINYIEVWGWGEDDAWFLVDTLEPNVDGVYPFYEWSGDMKLVVFSTTAYEVTAVSAGNGSVTPVEPTSYEEGTEATVVATPNSGYAFVNWTVTNGEGTVVVSTSGSYTFTVNEDVVLTANFAAIPTTPTTPTTPSTPTTPTTPENLTPSPSPSPAPAPAPEDEELDILEETLPEGAPTNESADETLFVPEVQTESIVEDVLDELSFEEETVPQGLPQTGGVASELLYTLGSGLAALGFLLKRKA